MSLGKVKHEKYFIAGKYEYNKTPANSLLEGLKNFSCPFSPSGRMLSIPSIIGGVVHITERPLFENEGEDLVHVDFYYMEGNDEGRLDEVRKIFLNNGLKIIMDNA